MTRGIQEAARVLEDILGEADALLRKRQKDRGFEFPHLFVAVTPDGQAVCAATSVRMDSDRLVRT
jgi:hypothetical protein